MRNLVRVGEVLCLGGACGVGGGGMKSDLNGPDDGRRPCAYYAAKGTAPFHDSPNAKVA